MTNEEKLKIAEEALSEIADPIFFFRKRAKENNHQLDGNMVIVLSNDPNYLKSIARRTLDQIKGEQT